MEESIEALVRGLLAQGREREWVEFKANNDDPEQIGEYASALSNSAALADRAFGFLVWGVEDGSLRVVGTTVEPRRLRKGNEPLEGWLARMLSPGVEVQFGEAWLEGKRLAMMRVQAATSRPVAFGGTAWVRVGEQKRKLKDCPAKERMLWLSLEHRPFEVGLALTDLSDEGLLGIIETPKLFDLLRQPLPSTRVSLLERLVEEGLVQRQTDGRWAVSNLGALLLARQWRSWPGLWRKALRVIRYRGRGRLETERERDDFGGYAVNFEEMVQFILSMVPHREELGVAERREVWSYPPRAIRELLANTLIHQDFLMTGTGPMVEIFDDRIEFSNPGLSLVEPLRFIDHTPRSRNEVLGAMMRRMNLCEERGSGFDKIVADVEAMHLPAPDIRMDSTHTRVVLFAPVPFGELDRKTRVRACYQHCCLHWASGLGPMTNTSLRGRFDLSETDPPVASRIIKDTLQEALIKPSDPDSRSRKHASYLPFWA